LPRLEDEEETVEMRKAIIQAERLASRFLGWWLGELAALVPGPVRRIFAGDNSFLSFELAGDRIVVRRASGGKLQEVASLDKHMPVEELQVIVSRLLRKHASRTTAIVLALPEGQVLHKILDLPAVAEEGLRELLYFELDRQTPYRPEQVRYDFRVTKRDPSHRRMKVELIVAPIEVVEWLKSLAAGWGLTAPVSVTAAGIDNPSNPVFDLSGEAPKRPSRGGGIALALLAILAAGMLAVGIWMPLQAQRAAAREAEAVLAEAQAKARTAADLRDELDRRAKAGSFLVRRKNEAPMMVAVLADLTRLLPDDVWLFELHVKGNEVRARGYAPAASAVLELVERGPAFRNARFTSPVTRVPGIDAERFDLTFELAGPTEKES
jgi:general secretion pathway protein L